MAFDWVQLVRMIHIVAATIWVGGAVFAVGIMMPNVAAAGPAGKSFMMTVVRRGGFGKFFGPLGALTILAGAIVYWQLGYDSGPFANAAASMVTIGMILGIAAFVEGLAVAMPVEKRMRAAVLNVGPQGPSPEQAKELEGLAAKMKKAGHVSTGLIVLALILMAGRTVF